MNCENRNVMFELVAALERQAGCQQLQVQAHEGATIGDALLLLQHEYPELAGAIERCACAVGDAIVPRLAPLPRADPIVLLPPVSGG
jgi:molybdopterin synthase sulfur carrier subunit